MPSHDFGSDDLAKAWDEKPDVIRSFIEVRPQYEQLCNEVEYILRKRMTDSLVEYSAITRRAKTLKSFAEKLSRKEYDNPLTDITDFAGVRLVYLYQSDRHLIEEIIESEFQVIEKADKVEQQEADQFGYGALHYLVHLGPKASGARYDDLKNLVCEIQVRTVLQDAWAIIDHHLSYKKESDVPKILRRKLNSLVGLFETADDQFDKIRKEREDYKRSVKSNLTSDDALLNQEANLDNLLEFLKLRNPSQSFNMDVSGISNVLNRAIEYGYKTLLDLDDLLQRTEKARIALRKEIGTPPTWGELARAIALEHPPYRKAGKWGGNKTRAAFEKYENLVQPKEELRGRE